MIIQPQDKPPEYNELELKPVEEISSENSNINTVLPSTNRIQSPAPPTYNAFLRNVW